MIKLVAHRSSSAVRQVDKVLEQWNWDHPMQLVITQFKRRRTDDQRGKLHGMLRDLANHNDVSEEYMKQQWAKGQTFWPSSERIINGYPEWVPKSEAQLTVEEESEIISRLQAIGDEFSVQWSEPA
jgi:hypothetical protein